MIAPIINYSMIPTSMIDSSILINTIPSVASIDTPIIITNTPIINANTNTDNNNNNDTPTNTNTPITKETLAKQQKLKNYE